MSSSLSGRQVLALGIDNEIGSHLCLRLALDGCTVFGLGGNAQVMAQIAREVNDVRGHFEWAAARDMAVAQTWIEATVKQDTLAVVALGTNGHLPHLSGTDRPVAGTLPTPYDSVQALISGDRALAGADIVSLRLELKSGQSGAPPNAPHTLQFPANTAAVVADATTTLLSRNGTCGRCEARFELAPEQIRVVACSMNGRGDVGVKPSEPFLTYGVPTSHDVYVARTDRGRGVFAARAFSKGDVVIHTVGTPIDFQTEHSIQIAMDRHIEPNPPVRHLNHSCAPNLGVRTNAHGLPDFVARRSIAVGDEVTFDYAMTEFQHYVRTDPRLEFSLVCRCGSERCRGRLGYYSELPDDLRREYAGYTSRYLLEYAQLTL